MGTKTYSEKLKDPRWQRKRLEILQRDDFLCRRCLDGSTTLHVHHLSYHKEPWDAPNDRLETLCQDCHKVVSGCDNINFIPVLKFKNQHKTILFTGDVSGDGEAFITMYQLTPESEITSSFEIDQNQFHQLTHFFNEFFNPEIIPSDNERMD